MADVKTTPALDVVQVDPAFRAQPAAILATQWPSWQREQELLANQRRQVDLVAVTRRREFFGTSRTNRGGRGVQSTLEKKLGACAIVRNLDPDRLLNPELRKRPLLEDTVNLVL